MAKLGLDDGAGVAVDARVLLRLLLLLLLLLGEDAPPRSAPQSAHGGCRAEAPLSSHCSSGAGHERIG
eukprot:2914350-Alexandrium_andersonii.AAC.1